MKKENKDRKLPLLDWFIGGAVYDVTLGFLLIILGHTAGVGGITYILSLLVSKLIQKSIPFYIWICIACILLVIVIIFLRKKQMRNSYLDYRYPRKQIRPKYIVEKVVVKYTVEKGSHLNFSNDIQIRALSNTFNRFTKKYFWTGLSSVNIPNHAECVGVTKITDAVTDLSSSPWKTFDVYINPINKNETCQCFLKWPDIPNCKVGNTSHVSYSTDEPTKEIVFEIKLGKQYAGKTIRYREYQSLGALTPLTGQTGDYKFDNDGFFTITIPAKRFRYYILDWNWIGGKSEVQCNICHKKLNSADYSFCPHCGHKIL